MNPSSRWVSLGLCWFAFACGSSESSGPAPNTGGASVGGAGQAAAGAAAQPSAGEAQGGAADNAGAAAQAGSAGHAASSGADLGGASQGGASQGGAGQGGAGQGGGASGAGGSAGSKGGVLDPALPPGQNFDLSQFVLQLPVASGTSVLQIKDLANYSSEYFYTEPDGAMSFWCPVTGAHTPNTHYPRTELREVAPGGDWSITGTHTLKATFKMIKNPPSGGTIIGQIHGNATDGTGEVLKLEWTTANAIIASVEKDTAPAQQVNLALGSYALGALITYVIRLENRLLTVTITDAKGSKSVSSSYAAASWQNDKYYFKLGDYVQADTGTSAQGARVSFYAFEVQHGL